MVTHAKLSPKMVNPRDTAGNAEQKTTNKMWQCVDTREISMIAFHLSPFT